MYQYEAAGLSDAQSLLTYFIKPKAEQRDTFATASDTARIALAPNLALFSEPSREFIFSSISFCWVGSIPYNKATYHSVLYKNTAAKVPNSKLAKFVCPAGLTMRAGPMLSLTLATAFETPLPTHLQSYVVSTKLACTDQNCKQISDKQAIFYVLVSSVSEFHCLISSGRSARGHRCSVPAFMRIYVCFDSRIATRVDNLPSNDLSNCVWRCCTKVLSLQNGKVV